MVDSWSLFVYNFFVVAVLSDMYSVSLILICASPPIQYTHDTNDTILNKKLIRRWDSERELSLWRYRTRTTEYNRLVHSTRKIFCSLRSQQYLYPHSENYVAAPASRREYKEYITTKHYMHYPSADPIHIQLTHNISDNNNNKFLQSQNRFRWTSFLWKVGRACHEERCLSQTKTVG